MTSQAKSLLGELLVNHGLVTDPQLAKALEEQKGSAKRLGEILIDAGVITREQLEEMLEHQRRGESDS